jgi:hypothetical protein
MISCKEATEMVVKQPSKHFSLWDKMRLWMHLAMCRFCALFARQNKLMDELSSHLDEAVSVTMPDASKSKVLEELQK